MFRLIGAALVLIGGAGVGVGAAKELGRRTGTLSAFLAALDRMEAELTFRLTPMPELLSRLSGDLEGPVGMFFSQCEQGLSALGDVPFSKVWNQALQEEGLALLPEDRVPLEQLGAVLGQYDVEGQRNAMEGVRHQLTLCLEAAKRKQGKIGRVYRALGISAGVLCILLFL
ncbi:MAG: stage III sporulation protein AB [Oscillospiraceae bacterium]|jgi:stage III sporulation protein AB